MRTVAVTRVASPHEGSELFNALSDAQQAAAVHLIPEASAHGLRGSSFWSLVWLTRLAEPHPTELARRLGITAPACTAMVDQLVESGFVARHPSEGDRRQVVLAVTPKGRRVVDGIWGLLDREISKATEGIPAHDLATTARVLHAVADRLRAERGPP